MSKKYIYGAWKDISSKSLKKYIRICSNNNIDSMNCVIQYKDDIWQAEIPKSLNIPNFGDKKYFFIKDLNYFDKISEAVLWVDIEMSKFSFNSLEKPFIFGWY